MFNIVFLCKNVLFDILLFCLVGFCNSLKRDNDKVVMVYAVEVYGGIYSTQWLNGRMFKVNLNLPA